MVLLRDLMTSPHQHQTTIIRSTLIQVDQTLQTPEPGPVRVLILMRPRFVDGSVFTVGPLNVDDVEGDDQVFVVKYPGENRSVTWDEVIVWESNYFSNASTTPGSDLTFQTHCS